MTELPCLRLSFRWKPKPSLRSHVQSRPQACAVVLCGLLGSVDTVNVNVSRSRSSQSDDSTGIESVGGVSPILAGFCTVNTNNLHMQAPGFLTFPFGFSFHWSFFLVSAAHGLDEEQVQIQSMALRFAKEEMAPFMLKWDQEVRSAVTTVFCISSL